MSASQPPNPLKCIYCLVDKKPCANRAELRDHYQRKHATEPNPTDAPPKKLVCRKYCQNEFTTENRLQGHEAKCKPLRTSFYSSGPGAAVTHSESDREPYRLDPPAQVGGPPPPILEDVCYICKHRPPFANRGSCTEHYRKKHPGDIPPPTALSKVSARPWKCPRLKCPAYFINQTGFDLHVSTRCQFPVDPSQMGAMNQPRQNSQQHTPSIGSDGRPNRSYTPPLSGSNYHPMDSNPNTTPITQGMGSMSMYQPIQPQPQGQPFPQKRYHTPPSPSSTQGTHPPPQASIPARSSTLTGARPAGNNDAMASSSLGRQGSYRDQPHDSRIAKGNVGAPTMSDRPGSLSRSGSHRIGAGNSAGSMTMGELLSHGPPMSNQSNFGGPISAEPASYAPPFVPNQKPNPSHSAEPSGRTSGSGSSRKSTGTSGNRPSSGSSRKGTDTSCHRPRSGSIRQSSGSSSMGPAPIGTGTMGPAQPPPPRKPTVKEQMSIDHVFINKPPNPSGVLPNPNPPPPRQTAPVPNRPCSGSGRRILEVEVVRVLLSLRNLRSHKRLGSQLEVVNDKMFWLICEEEETRNCKGV